MKLTYKILWLDDKIDELFIEDEYDQELKTYLSDQGFIPEIIAVSTEDDFFEKLDSSFDLILTDYNLKEKEGETRDGDLIVKAVRDQSIFTEIIFYSARGEVKDTYKLDRITFVETNKMTDPHQEALIKEVLKLIDLTIKKFQHIVVMRGMIMHETSSLDVLIAEILIKLIEKGDKASKIDTIKKKYLKTTKDFESEINKIDNLERILQIIGADHRVRGVLRNIEDGEIKKILNNYSKEVISIRNKFAHAVLEEDENGDEIFKNKKEDIIFNAEYCKEIRQNITRHKANLDELVDKL